MMTTDGPKPGHTKLWQSLVERAVQRAQKCGQPFSIETLLDACGIFEWSPYRKAAENYLHELIAATSTNSSPTQH